MYSVCGITCVHNIILDVVNRDVLRQAARVALPLPEIAEDPVVSDLGPIGGERKQAAFIGSHRLRQSTIDAHRVGTLRPAVRSIAARKKNDALAIRRPANHLVENAHAIAKRLRLALVERQLLRLPALGTA